MSKLVYSVIESPLHPDFSSLYQQYGLDDLRLSSGRKAIAELKKQPPELIVAEFFYGYGNNYAGVNISNLDVLLYSMQRYARDTRVVVLVEKGERQYVDKLNDIFPLSSVLIQPVSTAMMAKQLEVMGYIKK